MKIDMHVHTSYSDGLNTPQEVVSLALELGLDGIAITDHDCIDGVREAVEFSQGKDIRIIPGIEISCEYGGEEVHILGYFINYEDKGLITLTNKLKVQRYERGIEIIGKLKKLGFELDIDDVMKNSINKSIGRGNIANLLVEKGYVKDTEEAFKKYIGNDMPAYVEKYKLNVEYAIELIHNLKGLAVIAHPGDLSDKNFLDLIELDIQGIECIHPKHNEELSNYFKDKAREKSLIMTGGSDYHGKNLKGRDGLGKYLLEVDTFNYFGKE